MNDTTAQIVYSDLWHSSSHSSIGIANQSPCFRIPFCARLFWLLSIGAKTLLQATIISLPNYYDNLWIGLLVHSPIYNQNDFLSNMILFHSYLRSILSRWFNNPPWIHPNNRILFSTWKKCATKPWKDMKKPYNSGTSLRERSQYEKPL